MQGEGLATARASRYVTRMTEYQLVDSKDTVYRDGTIKLHTEEGFEGMRKEVLEEFAKQVVKLKGG